MKAGLLHKITFLKNSIYLFGATYLLFLYLDINTMDLGNGYGLYLKYFIILICLVVSLFIGEDYISRLDKYLVQLVRVLTLLADYYLVIAVNFQAGLMFFCIVQFVYIVRHTFKYKKPSINIILILVIFIIGKIFISKSQLALIDNQMKNLGMVYAGLLLSSLVIALGTIKNSSYKKSEAYLIAIGMSLFFLCDINVLLFNILAEGKIRFICGFLMWIFYAPSQLLLSLSGFNDSFLKKLIGFKVKDN